MAKHETTVVLKAKDETGKALKRAEKGMKDTEKAAGGLLATVGRLAPAILGAFSVGAIAAFGAELIRQQRELAGLSASTGLAVKQIRTFGAATQTVGVSTEQFADIVKDVNDKLGEFVATGKGPFEDFFDNVPAEVRKTAEELARLSGPNVLIAVKKSMDAANLSMKEQIFILESLGNDASKLIPLLENEGEAFLQIAEGAERAVVALDKLQETNLEEAARSIEGASGQFQQFFANILSSTAPVGEAVAGFFSDIGRAVNKVTFDTALEDLRELREEAEILQERLTLKQKTGGQAFALVDLEGQLASVNKDIAILVGQFAPELIRQFEEGQKAAEGVTGEIKSATEQAEALAGAFDTAKKSADSVAESIKTIQDLQTERQVERGTTLDALITSSKAREALGRGETEEAAKFAAQAAEQFAGIEEREGPQNQFGGFIQNQLAIAQQAQQPGPRGPQEGPFLPFTGAQGRLEAAQTEPQKVLRLEIDIAGETREFEVTESGVKRAGEFASGGVADQIKQADKRANGVVGR